MSTYRNNSEKALLDSRLNNYFSKKNIIHLSSKTLNNDFHGKLMKKENLLDIKLNFKPIFERINRNNRKFRRVLLNNLEQRENNIKKIISLDNLINFIYQTGIPYKIDFKKNLKKNVSKEREHPNLQLEKIKLGPMDYFNLDTFTKGNISKNIINRKNEEQLFNSKNFITTKSGIPQNISVYTAKNILKRIFSNKNDLKNKIFEKRKVLSSTITDKIKSKRKIAKKKYIFNTDINEGRNEYYTFSKLNSNTNIKSKKNSSLKKSGNKNDLSYKININSESKKLINSKELNNELNSITKSLIKSKYREMYSSDLFSKKIKTLKPKKNLKMLLLGNDKKKMDNNLKIFKNSITELNKYIKKNHHNTIEDNFIDYTKEEKQYLKNKQFQKISKTLGDMNNKMRKSINYYDKIMNKRNLSERDKDDILKITKIFSSFGQKTINNMVTNLGICQNHVKDQLINVIEDYSSSKKTFIKQLDPTLEIILDKKLKKVQDQNLQNEYEIGENYDFIKDRHYKEYQKKEIERLGEIIGKINNKVAFDLSNYLIIYNKNIGNKIEEMKEENIRKKRNNTIKYLKKSLENQIYNIKKLKQRNIFEYNKIIDKFDDYYTKINNEKKLNEEYRKIFFSDD